jgi:hypothetical protein
MSYLLFLRFVPAFPFWAVNLMAAILGVPLRPTLSPLFRYHPGVDSLRLARGRSR